MAARQQAAGVEEPQRPGTDRSRPAAADAPPRAPARAATVPAPPRYADRRAPRRPPDRTRDFVRRRSGRLRRAAWRVGGPDWGIRLAMSLIIAVMLLTVTGFAFERLTGVDVLPDGPAARFWPAPRDFPVLARSLPVSIRARSVRIDAPVHGVGNTTGGAIDVPRGERFDEAGWYDKGPTPGEYGPAVIVGHVDNGAGPSVFHKLSRLRPGNRVEVDRADGSVAVFEVNSVKRYDRDELPADEVFGDFSRPGLRLITCGGRWVGGATGYADNVVVYASLVKARR
nr:class F sortase [Phytohabitans houttuyneae]